MDNHRSCRYLLETTRNRGLSGSTPGSDDDFIRDQNRASRFEMFVRHNHNDRGATRAPQRIYRPGEERAPLEFTELLRKITVCGGTLATSTCGDDRRGMPRSYQRSLTEDFVEHLLGFVFVTVLREGELGNEDLTSFRQHALLARS